MSKLLSIGYYWKYNPLQNKPTTLDPVEPWGSYYYYGPDPAAGCSYGLFEDKDTDFKMLSCDSGKVVYSPATGKEMAKVEDVPADEIKDLLSKTGASAGVHRVQCQGCKASMMCSRDLTEADVMHCAACGCVMVGKKISAGKDAQTMATEVKKTEGVATLKDRVRASILEKRKAAAAAAAPVKELTLAQKLRERVLARRAAKAAEEKPEPKEGKDDEYVSLDSIMEAMDEEEGKDEKAKADDTEKYLHDEKHEDSKDGAATSEEKEEVKVEEKKPEGEGEEFMDLDMVLSMLKRKARVAKARARIKARREVKAAEAAKAAKATAGEEKKEPKAEEKKEEPKGDKAKADDTEKFLHDEKHEDSKDGAATSDSKGDEHAHDEKEAPHASEPKVEQEQPGLTAQKPAEPGMTQQENPVPGGAATDNKMGELHSPKKEGEMDVSKESEAMRFEPLASTEKLAAVAKEDIDMMLYGEDSENPTWNVSVAGTPTCRIPLKSQAHADEIRKVFCSDEYAFDLIEHCVKSGFVPTMKKVGATFWANHTSDQKIAARYQTMASVAIDSEKSKIVAAFREDFISALKIVTAGMSKNFYPELGNSLKDAFYGNLCTAGLPAQTAESVVEKSFAEGSSEYFNTLFDKATEYLNLTRETRAEIANAISHSSTLALASDKELQSAPATLSDRLVSASATAQVAQQFQVTQAVSIDADDFKNQLKSSWVRKR